MTIGTVDHHHVVMLIVGLAAVVIVAVDLVAGGNLLQHHLSIVYAWWRSVSVVDANDAVVSTVTWAQNRCWIRALFAYFALA